MWVFPCSHLMENQISNIEKGVFDELKELERLWEHITKTFTSINQINFPFKCFLSQEMIAFFLCLFFLSTQSPEQKPSQPASRAALSEEWSPVSTVSTNCRALRIFSPYPAPSIWNLRTLLSLAQCLCPTQCTLGVFAQSHIQLIRMCLECVYLGHQVCPPCSHMYMVHKYWLILVYHPIAASSSSVGLTWRISNTYKLQSSLNWQLFLSTGKVIIGLKHLGFLKQAEVVIGVQGSQNR